MNILDKIKDDVPKKPGCYIYKNKNNQIIYIGKAKNLYNRMSSYFNRVNNLKTTKLVSEISSFEYIITKNEREALILENNLIKQNNPKYNILLKDDKRYPFILLTKEKHPKIISVRNTKIKGTYFGPFPSVSFVNEIIELLNKEVPLRKCKTIPNEECIYYHLNQCYAPCIKKISDEQVSVYSDRIKNYLSGKYNKLKKLINEKMMIAAENLDFEKAQNYKLLLSQLENFTETQSVEIAKDITLDIYGIKYDDSWISLSIISIQKGKVTNVTSRLLSYIDDYQDAIISTLYDYYEENEIPEKFIIENDTLSAKISSLFVNQKQNTHLNYYKSLMDMANINAHEYFKNNVDKIMKKVMNDKESGYDILKRYSKSELNIIEMYDISHTAGDAQVGAKIAFEKGKKNPKLYRKYKIKNAQKADDYGSMQEVIERRTIRMIQEDETYPDMLIVDGGKGQVRSALNILEKYGLENEIILIGLVKDDNHKTRAMINKNMEEMPLDAKSELYKFFYSMQEEVHRFAIDFHRTLQSKSSFSSVLDNIEGLGIKRKRLLIDNFQTVENIKNAQLNEITKLGIPKKVAENILKKLNK